MIRTKQAKRLLTKGEQRHLTEMHVHSLAAFIRTRAAQIEQRKISPFESCFECRIIARKLGLN